MAERLVPEKRFTPNTFSTHRKPPAFPSFTTAIADRKRGLPEDEVATVEPTAKRRGGTRAATDVADPGHREFLANAMVNWTDEAGSYRALFGKLSAMEQYLQRRCDQAEEKGGVALQTVAAMANDYRETDAAGALVEGHPEFGKFDTGQFLGRAVADPTATAILNTKEAATKDATRVLIALDQSAKISASTHGMCQLAAGKMRALAACGELAYLVTTPTCEESFRQSTGDNYARMAQLHLSFELFLDKLDANGAACRQDPILANKMRRIMRLMSLLETPGFTRQGDFNDALNVCEAILAMLLAAYRRVLVVLLTDDRRLSEAAFLCGVPTLTSADLIAAMVNPGTVPPAVGPRAHVGATLRALLGKIRWPRQDPMPVRPIVWQSVNYVAERPVVSQPQAQAPPAAAPAPTAPVPPAAPVQTAPAPPAATVPPSGPTTVTAYDPIPPTEQNPPSSKNGPPDTKEPSGDTKRKGGREDEGQSSSSARARDGDRDGMREEVVQSPQGGDRGASTLEARRASSGAGSRRERDDTREQFYKSRVHVDETKNERREGKEEEMGDDGREGRGKEGRRNEERREERRDDRREERRDDRREARRDEERRDEERREERRVDRQDTRKEKREERWERPGRK